MILARTLLLSLVLVGCESQRTKAPDWVASAPAAAVTAISCRAGWALEQSRLQTVLERFPPAGRALEIFLRRLGINPGQETGRITVYLFHSAPPLAAGFLLQLEGFPSPGALQVAIADAFPAAGTLALSNRELPLFEVLDLGGHRIRAIADGEGRVWLGDVATLAQLNAGAGKAAKAQALTAAAIWIGGGAVIQGFIRPPGLLLETSNQIPGDLARDLPKGVEALVWGVTPGAAQTGPNGFELAISGTPEAIQQVAPWLQRFVAAAAAMPGPVPTPEILQEKRRIGLRCLLSQEQVDMAMVKLGQPGVPCH